MKDTRRRDAFSGTHPAVAFGYFAVVLSVTMFIMHPAFLLISLSSALCYTGVLKGARSVLKTMLAAIPMLIVVAAINPLFNHGGVTVLGYMKSGNPVTLESIVYGGAMALMFISVLMWFSCYNEVVTSDKFIFIFGRIIPSLSLIFSMVLRFVPRFRTELRVISASQKCIGRDVSNGNLWERAQNGMKLLSILVTWALENAIETANSMKARGYGLPGRTAFSIFRWHKRDVVLAAAELVLTATIIIGAAFGAVSVQYVPSIKIAATGILSTAVQAAFLLFCMLPVILNIMEELQWRHLRSKI